MPLHLPFHLGERLGALALLLVLLAVFTGVSLTQAGLLDDGADVLEDITLPALRQSQDLRRAVDEARGLEALVVLASDDTHRRTLATQLLRQRSLVDSQLAGHERRSLSDIERQLQASVRRQLAGYWASQDKVLALVAGGDPASQLAQARLLLAGESQSAWRALGAALEAWQQHHAERAAALARQSRSQAEWLRLAASGVLASVLLSAVLLLVAHVRRRQQGQAPGLPPSASGLPETLDRIALHSRLVALNAAVQAARMGPPTAAERAERAHLAAEAEALAQRCAAAQKGLRLRQPATRRSVQPSATLPPSDSLSDVLHLADASRAMADAGTSTSGLPEAPGVHPADGPPKA